MVLLEVSDLLLDVLTGFLDVYVVDVVGASTTQAALAVAVRMAAGLVGELALVPLLATRSGTAVLRGSAAAALVVYPAFLAVPGLGPKVVLLALLSVLTAAWYPVLAAQLFAALPGQSGVVVAVSTVSAVVGGLLPAVLGLAAERFGLPVALAAMAASPLVILFGVRAAGRADAAPALAA